MFDDVLNDLTTITASRGSRVVFHNGNYAAIPFEQNNYHTISPQQQDLAYVDGGNSCLVETPGAEIHLVRVAVLGKELHRKQFLVLARNSGNKIVVKRYDTGEELQLKEDSLRAACERVRRIAEIEVAQKARENIVILDGTLETRHAQEQEKIDALCEKKVVASVAKTCSLITETGTPVTVALNREGTWAYYPVAINHNQLHKADMAFAKLHASSRHVLRVEIARSCADKLTQILNSIAYDSRDVSFPGYPYGLIKVDRIARISEQESALLKTQLQIQAGKNWNNIQEQINALNAHSILDSL